MWEWEWEWDEYMLSEEGGYPQRRCCLGRAIDTRGTYNSGAVTGMGRHEGRYSERPMKCVVLQWAVHLYGKP